MLNKYTYPGMYPQWSVLTTTQIKQPPLQTHLPALKYQHEQKCLVSITSWFTQYIHMYIHSVYKESPRHYLSIETKDYKFGNLKPIYITTTLRNLGTSLPTSSCKWPMHPTHQCVPHITCTLVTYYIIDLLWLSSLLADLVFHVCQYSKHLHLLTWSSLSVYILPFILAFQ